MSDAAITAIVQQNVARVRSQIAEACYRVERDAEEVMLIGVTKSVDRSIADVLIAAGVHDIAENRVQDAIMKFGRRSASPPLPADVRLHMIGNLQTNKARDVVGLFNTVHSVNRPEVADALQREAMRQGVERDILLEVNAANDTAKHGAGLGVVESLYGYVVNHCENLRLLGLMTIAAQVAHPEDTRATFRTLRMLRDTLVHTDPSHPLPILSMGMSNDFSVAIEEGATHVRVGRALFVGLASPT